MKHLIMATTVLGTASTGAFAGGIDRSGTPIDIIFETGNYATLSYGHADPSITGIDEGPAGARVRNIADSFGIVGAALKLDVSENVALAFILDQPYGVDVEYGPESDMLGDTLADADSYGITTLVRYKATDRFSVYGGPRFVRAEGQINLGGSAYDVAPGGVGFDGYESNYASDTGTGYVVGAAYEIPDIAFRAALTYHSEIDLSFQTIETFPASAAPIPEVTVPTGVPLSTGVTKSTLPQSIKLAVQSGIATDTLAFGSIRWVDHEEFSIIPPVVHSNLAALKNSVTYELGIGRRFTERFSARTSVIYEDVSGGDLVSPLKPVKGFTALSIGGQYQLTEILDISGGFRYTWLEDARAAPNDVVAADFRNNDALSFGIELGLRF
jgi:long-subunit fatty acid transport protein